MSESDTITGVDLTVDHGRAKPDSHGPQVGPDTKPRRDR